MTATGWDEMLPLAFLFSLMAQSSMGQTYNGFHFMDNLLPERFGPENGYADYEFDIPIPDLVQNINYKLFY